MFRVHLLHFTGFLNMGLPDDEAECSLIIDKEPAHVDIHLACLHLVECFFQKLNLFRRIATRYEKLAKRFLAIVQLGCIMMIWLA